MRSFYTLSYRIWQTWFVNLSKLFWHLIAKLKILSFHFWNTICTLVVVYICAYVTVYFFRCEIVFELINLYIFDGIKLENISYYEKLDCHEILSDSYFTRDHHLMVGKKFTDIWISQLEEIISHQIQCIIQNTHWLSGFDSKYYKFRNVILRLFLGLHFSFNQILDKGHFLFWRFF